MQILVYLHENNKIFFSLMLSLLANACLARRILWLAEVYVLYDMTWHDNVGTVASISFTELKISSRLKINFFNLQVGSISEFQIQELPLQNSF